MIQELQEWLDNNHITYSNIDSDVIDIPEFGKCFIMNTDDDKYLSIFRKDTDGNIKFNSSENIQILNDEDIFYYVLKFGDNWYYYDTRKDFKLQILKYVGVRQPFKMNTPPKFVNLGVHSPFELLNGSFMLPDWCNKAKFLGQDAIGICDLNTMAGTLNLQKACESFGMKHIFGYSLVFIDEDDAKVEAKVYVQTDTGMTNLLRIQKAINVDSEDKCIPILELLHRGSGNVLVFGKRSAEWLKNNKDRIDDFYDAFDNVFFQVDLSEYKAERIDVKILDNAKIYFDELYETIAPVLIQDCYYLDHDDYKNKIILNKIDSGAAHEQSDDQYFKDIDEHYEMFLKTFDPEIWDIDDLFSECCENTVAIADGANAFYSTDRNFMPQYMLTEEESKKYIDRHDMFLSLLEDGFKKLVPKGKEEIYRKRLDYEIYILESTNNVDYMLVQYDTVNWARKNNIMVGCGRGSAGGALVLYLLGITLIDPIKYNLIFERFLLPERAGLYPSDVTMIGNSIMSKEYVKITLENGNTYDIDIDSELYVKRDGCDDPIKIYADELQDGDDILFDNKDLLFTLNEINHD